MVLRHGVLETVAAALQPLGERVAVGAPLGQFTTYRVGGSAAILVTAGSVDDLALIASATSASGVPVLVVGRGSNLLVADDGFPGVAVTLDRVAFAQIAVAGTELTAGAAVDLPVLARQSVEAGLSGLEWAVGVPGSVGGGVRMNAGGHGSDMAHTVRSCQVVDLGHPGRGPETLTAAQMDYAYRHSAIRPEQVVISAVFGLALGDRTVGQETIRQIVRWRREHQPGGQNAGSVFANPPGDSAGRLIESAGLKGRRWRTAMVSPKHANFIQAEPGGSSGDIFVLMQQVQAEVAAASGISLRPEVRTVGFGEEFPVPTDPQPQVES